VCLCHISRFAHSWPLGDVARLARPMSVCVWPGLRREWVGFIDIALVQIILCFATGPDAVCMLGTGTALPQNQANDCLGSCRGQANHARPLHPNPRCLCTSLVPCVRHSHHGQVEACMNTNSTVAMLCSSALTQLPTAGLSKQFAGALQGALGAVVDIEGPFDTPAEGARCEHHSRALPAGPTRKPVGPNNLRLFQDH
jgi:hypothetical protein